MSIQRTAISIAIGLLLAWLVAGCGAPEYVEHSIDNVCSTAKHNDLIRVTGVLKPIDTVLERDQRYRVLLVKDINQQEPWVGLWIQKGKGRNRMQPIAEGFSLEDVQVQTVDGRTVNAGDTMTVSGRFSTICELKADRIE
jgi:hypothetical protein